MESGGSTDDWVTQAKMDTLRVYGFSFQFPMTSKLEFNPKFNRQEGDVAVKSPERATVFLTWGDLAKVTKKGETVEDHAKYSLERVKKSVQGKMEQIEQREVTVNGHSAIYNRVRLEIPKRTPFGRGQVQEVMSLHLHCERSGRYFLVYATSTPETVRGQERTVQGIIESLVCH